MTNVQSGLSAFSMPAVALGNRVWAKANSIAGRRLPMNPLIASPPQIERSHLRMRIQANGARTVPANAMRNNPSCTPDNTGGEPGPPPQPKRPTFIRMKELPHVAANSNSSR